MPLSDEEQRILDAVTEAIGPLDDLTKRFENYEPKLADRRYVQGYKLGRFIRQNQDEITAALTFGTWAIAAWLSTRIARRLRR